MDRPRIEWKNPEESTQVHNLKMLDSDMIRCLGDESMGGNAGDITIDGKSYSCAGANGYANSETGKIVAFGNIQYMPGKIRYDRNNSGFTLRVAIRINPDRSLSYFRILAFYPREGSRFSETGRHAIESAIEEWNKSKEN